MLCVIGEPMCIQAANSAIYLTLGDLSPIMAHIKRRGEYTNADDQLLLRNYHCYVF